MKRTAGVAVLTVLAVVLAVAPAQAAAVPRPDHVVIVVEENHSYRQTRAQPFLAALRAGGADMTNAHGVAHPSQPNYLALWSGWTHHLRNDSCPHRYTSASLGTQLHAVVYSESLPRAGFTGCSSGAYRRKHNPAANWRATAGPRHNRPMAAFPTDYTRLPRVSLVVPNLNHDMHDGSVARGDAWLRRHLGGYARWAKRHNSLLIVTFDEDDGTSGNRILTVFYGQHVRRGRYGERIDQVNVLHTVEAAFGVRHLGVAAGPITDIWR